ncbi:hypothetical protein C0J52_25318, partial [Blattella germanica]
RRGSGSLSLTVPPHRPFDPFTDSRSGRATIPNFFQQFLADRQHRRISLAVQKVFGCYSDISQVRVPEGTSILAERVKLETSEIGSDPQGGSVLVCVRVCACGTCTRQTGTAQETPGVRLWNESVMRLNKLCLGAAFLLQCLCLLETPSLAVAAPRPQESQFQIPVQLVGFPITS